MTIHLLFADGRLSGESHTIRNRSARLGSAIARYLAGEPVGHVAVGWAGTVIDPQLAGDRTYPFDTFVAVYPGLVCSVEVPGRILAPPEAFVRTYRGRRCTQTACRILRLAGVTVPDMRLPGTLLKWTRQHGYHIRSVERLRPRHSEGDGRDTGADVPARGGHQGV